ncbi:MAG: NYN domain-containing protein [Elainellaceae cyanobacterium]
MAHKFSAILVVDGYNVVGACPTLSQVRDRDGLEEARHRLTESLIGYGPLHDYCIWLVFDAYGTRGPATVDKLTDSLQIHYTPLGQTADTYIEKLCADFRYDVRKFEHRLIVATSDRAQRLMVVGYGAEWLSSQRLLSDVAAQQQQVRRRKKSKPRSSGRLSGSLDPVALQRLSQMRYGLSGK